MDLEDQLQRFRASLNHDRLGRDFRSYSKLNADIAFEDEETRRVVHKDVRNIHIHYFDMGFSHFATTNVYKHPDTGDWVTQKPTINRRRKYPKVKINIVDKIKVASVHFFSTDLRHRRCRPRIPRMTNRIRRSETIHNDAPKGTCNTYKVSAPLNLFSTDSGPLCVVNKQVSSFPITSSNVNICKDFRQLLLFTQTISVVRAVRHVPFTYKLNNSSTTIHDPMCAIVNENTFLHKCLQNRVDRVSSDLGLVPPRDNKNGIAQGEGFKISPKETFHANKLVVSNTPSSSTTHPAIGNRDNKTFYRRETESRRVITDELTLE